MKLLILFLVVVCIGMLVVVHAEEEVSDEVNGTIFNA